MPDNIQNLSLSWEHITEIGNLDNVLNGIEITIYDLNIDITKISKKIKLKLIKEFKAKLINESIAKLINESIDIGDLNFFDDNDDDGDY